MQRVHADEQQQGPQQQQQQQGSGSGHVQWRLRSGEVPCRGVNLGGWLVAEHWMTWDSVIWQTVPEEIRNQGEFQTMTFLGHANGDWRFEQHRANWITEQDIEEMKRFGVNMVRVPVGYWLAGFDQTDVSNKQEWRVFAPGALKFLDALVNDWCLKHNVAVLINIHGAKGSQNGRDHSAPPTPGVKYWSDYAENIENTVQFACFLADRYAKSEAFLGLGLLNEPEYPVDGNKVEHYYRDAYHRIRSTGNECVLITSPMLTEQGPPHMENLMQFPEFFNVWHEWHPYFIWGYENQSDSQLIDAVEKYAKQIESWRGNWLFIGEWSLGAPSSANFDLDKSKMEQFAKTQLATFAKAHCGWCFWAWRVANDSSAPSPWSFRQQLRTGMLKLNM